MITFFNLSFGQKKAKGFVYFGPAAYVPVKGGNPLIGGSFGFGAYQGLGSLGVSTDILSLRNSGMYANIYGDLRVKFKPSGPSPFVLFQPGFVLRNHSTGISQSTFTERGNLYVSGGIGFTTLLPKVGLTFQLKYSMISIKYISLTNGVVKSSTISRPGFVGLSFGAAF